MTIIEIGRMARWLGVLVLLMAAPSACAFFAIRPKHAVWRVGTFIAALGLTAGHAVLVNFLFSLNTNIYEGYAFHTQYRKWTGLLDTVPKWARPLPVVSFPWSWVWLACIVAVGVAALWGIVLLVRENRPRWLKFFLLQCVLFEMLFGTSFLYRRRYESGARRTQELFQACVTEIERIQASEVPEDEAKEFFRETLERELRFGYAHPNYQAMEAVLEELKKYPPEQ